MPRRYGDREDLVRREEAERQQREATPRATPVSTSKGWSTPRYSRAKATTPMTRRRRSWRSCAASQFLIAINSDFVALVAFRCTCRCGYRLPALYEFYKLATSPAVKPDFAAGYLASIVLFSIAVFSNDLVFNLIATQAVIIVLTIGCLVAAMLRGANFDKMIASQGATILGVLYIAFLGSHLVAFAPVFDQPCQHTCCRSSFWC